MQIINRRTARSNPQCAGVSVATVARTTAVIKTNRNETRRNDHDRRSCVVIFVTFLVPIPMLLLSCLYVTTILFRCPLPHCKHQTNYARHRHERTHRSLVPGAHTTLGPQLSTRLAQSTTTPVSCVSPLCESVAALTAARGLKKTTRLLFRRPHAFRIALRCAGAVYVISSACHCLVIMRLGARCVSALRVYTLVRVRD